LIPSNLSNPWINKPSIPNIPIFVGWEGGGVETVVVTGNVLVTVVVTGIVFVTVIGTVLVTGTITVLVTGTETVLVTGTVVVTYLVTAD